MQSTRLIISPSVLLYREGFLAGRTTIARAPEGLTAGFFLPFAPPPIIIYGPAGQNFTTWHTISPLLARCDTQVGNWQVFGTVCAGELELEGLGLKAGGGIMDSISAAGSQREIEWSMPGREAKLWLIGRTW